MLYASIKGHHINLKYTYYDKNISNNARLETFGQDSCNYILEHLITKGWIKMAL